MLFAVAVEVFRLDLIRAADGALPALNRKTAFGALLLALDRKNDGVYQLVKALLHVDNHGAQINPDLRSGKPRAVFRADGFFHIV